MSIIRLDEFFAFVIVGIRVGVSEMDRDFPMPSFKMESLILYLYNSENITVLVVPVGNDYSNILSSRCVFHYGFGQSILEYLK